MKNAFRFSAVLGAIVLALVLAGHGPVSAGQAPQAAADIVAGEGCTSILVGRDASTDGSIDDHPHLRLRHLRLDLATRPGRRSQAGLDAQDLPHFPVQDLAAFRGPQVGPLQEGLCRASRSPRSPTPTPITTACSAT